MASTEFHETLGELGIAQQRVAALFDVSPRAVRRWRDGERRVPRGVRILVRLLADGVVTVEQVEQAAVLPVRMNGGTELSAALPAQALMVEQVAVPLSARMNGGAESAPLHLEPTLEPSATFVEPAPEQPISLAEPALEQSVVAPTLESFASLLLEPTSEAFAKLAEPALEQSATLADSVTVVGSELTTAEKVAALTATACRWPCGDPRRSDFHF
jgi:hypothetical protein